MIRETIDMTAAPEFFEQAFEEPEKYWVVYTDGDDSAYVGEWLEMFTTLDDAIAYRLRPTETNPEYALETIAEQVPYCLADARPGIRIMARDQDGWFVLKEHLV